MKYSSRWLDAVKNRWYYENQLEWRKGERGRRNMHKILIRTTKKKKKEFSYKIFSQGEKESNLWLLWKLLSMLKMIAN